MYDSNMTFWKQQNYGDSRKFSGCWVFLGGKTILSATIEADT